jgi:hypothetical protein
LKKLYSQMSHAELDAEILEILEALPAAEFPSQKEQLERKYYTAKSYMLDLSDFSPAIYEIEGIPGERFRLDYINGIMGWGMIDNKEEASFPLAMLKRLQT